MDRLRSPISEETLDRYLAGLATPDEIAAVEHALATNPVARRGLERVHLAAEAAPGQAPIMRDAWARFERRLENAGESANAFLPWWDLTAQWARSIVMLGIVAGIVAIATIGFASAITPVPESSQMPGMSSVALMSAVTNDVAEQPLVEMTIHSSDDHWFTAPAP
jgi:hypothetical protein